MKDVDDNDNDGKKQKRIICNFKIPFKGRSVIAVVCIDSQHKLIK